MIIHIELRSYTAVSAPWGPEINEQRTPSSYQIPPY